MEEEGKLRILDDLKVIPDWHREDEADKKRRGVVAAIKQKPVRLTAFGAAAIVAAVLFRRFLRRRRAGSAKAILEKGLQLPHPGGVQAQQLLQGLTFLCSAVFDVEGNTSRYSEDRSEKAQSSAAVNSLLDSGASLVGRTVTEELNLGLLGDAVDGSNPAAPECSVSGSGCGPALAVAAGLADIGLAPDHLAGARIQSSLFGLSAFRPTQGCIPGNGVAKIAGSLDSVAWLTSNPALHPQIAQAYKLPGGGGSFSNTDLLQLVVASEVFELFGESGKLLRRVALKASKRWAGAEMTANGFLITYLRKAVPSRRSFLGADNDADEVLEGIRRAAVTLQYYELLNQYGYMLEDPESVPPSVLEQLNNAQQVGQEEVEAAEKVREETSLAMRSILKECVIIIPALSAPQPAQGSETDELKSWERGALQLSALATMTGCPQATLPVLQKGDAPPLSLSLLALPKSDQRLAQVTAALAPLVAEESQQAADPAPSDATPDKQEGRLNGKLKPQDEGAQAEQDRLKAEGNAAFKEGRLQEAIEKYSEAIKRQPKTTVLYSNRAQALLKVGRYREAEQDCNQALKEGLNAKALLRRGTARALLNNLEGAVKDFKQVLVLEPTNRQARTELMSLSTLGGEGVDFRGSDGLAGTTTNRSDISV